MEREGFQLLLSLFGFHGRSLNQQLQKGGAGLTVGGSGTVGEGTVQHTEVLPFFGIAVQACTDGRQIQGFRFHARQGLVEVLLEFCLSPLLAGELLAEHRTFGLQRCDEGVLLHDGLALPRMMGGTAHGAGRTLLQVSA